MSSKRKALSMAQSDEELSSDSDGSYSSGGDDSDEETLGEKRTRLAKQYLAMVEHSAKKGDDDPTGSSSIDDLSGEDAVNARLQVLHQKSTSSYTLPLRASLSSLDLTAPPASYHKCRSTPTAVALRRGTAYASEKNGSVYSLDVSTGARTYMTCRGPGSPGVLSLCASADGNSLAAGRADGTTAVYDVRSGGVAATLGGHKSGVTALVYAQQPPYGLYTASEDRCIRNYTSDNQYVETLYGHQAPVMGITCMRSKPVSVGRDRTARVWDIDNR